MRPRVEADAALAAAAQQHFFARDVHGVGHWSRLAAMASCCTAAHRSYLRLALILVAFLASNRVRAAQMRRRSAPSVFLTTLHPQKHGAVRFYVARFESSQGGRRVLRARVPAPRRLLRIQVDAEGGPSSVTPHGRHQLGAAARGLCDDIFALATRSIIVSDPSGLLPTEDESLCSLHCAWRSTGHPKITT